MSITPDDIKSTYWRMSSKQIAAKIAEGAGGSGMSQDQVLAHLLAARVSHWTKWLAIMTGGLAIATFVLAVATLCSN
jgi:hypothetical protein